MAGTDTAGEHETRMVHRLIFFSDAVFAIVLTLLAIELHPPHLEGGQTLADGLWHMAPQFMAFGISFALIGLWWLIHMRQMRKLERFDWPTAICNLLALGCITLLPFATAVFGRDPASLDNLQLYWIVSAAAAWSMTLLFLVMTRGGGRLVGGIGLGEWMARLMYSIAPGIAFVAGVYFCYAGMEWPARFAALIMFPIMMLAPLFYRPAKTAKR